MPLDRRIRDGMRRMAADLEPDVEGRLEATLRGSRRAATRQQLRNGLVFATAVMAVLLVGPSLYDAFRNRSPGVGVSPSSTPAASLTGTYATTLVSSDVAVTSNRMAGNWTIGFGPSQILTVTAPPDFTGTYSGYSFAIDGPLLRTDLFGEDVCTPILPGTYRWRLTGDQLTLTAVDDACPGRVGLLTSAAWSAVTAR